MCVHVGVHSAPLEGFPPQGPHRGFQCPQMGLPLVPRPTSVRSPAPGRPAPGPAPRLSSLGRGLFPSPRCALCLRSGQTRDWLRRARPGPDLRAVG